MTAMTDEKRVSDRLYVFAKILASDDWTSALLAAYNPTGSTQVRYETAKAALVADLTALARRSQEPDGWRLVPVEPTEAMVREGVSKALSTTLGAGYKWPDYMADLWKTFLAAAPIPQSNEAK